MNYIKTFEQIKQDKSLRVVKTMRDAIIIRDSDARETARWAKVFFNGSDKEVFVKTRDIHKHK